MYIITVYNDGFPTIIHGGTQKLANAKIAREKNAIASLSFDLYPSQAGWNELVPLATTVEVMNARKGKIEFEGRVLKPVPEMGSDGLVKKSVVCEDVTAYLHDSQQPYQEERHWADTDEKTGLYLFIEHLLSVHNAKVEDHKKVYPGNITYQTFETSGGVTKAVTRQSTWDNLKEKLLDVFGGEMRVRRGDDGLLYLDYAEKIGTTRATRIALGRNMKQAKREVDPTKIITRLYPYGAKLKTIETDENGTETEVETEERLSIESVNGGVPYIDTEDAIEIYGVIEGTMEWDDVEVASRLLTKAREWLGENNKMPVTTTLTALDLSLLGLDYDDFQLYDWYQCENELIDMDDELEIVSQVISITEPHTSTIDMGETTATVSKKLSSVSSLQSAVQRVESQTNTKITNVENKVRSTTASLEVMEESITSKVSETIEETTVKYVEEAIAEIDSTLALSIESSNGSTFLGGNVETLLTAHVFMAKKELTESEIADLGAIVWYKDGERYATGLVLPINADYSEGNKSTIVAQLEREV